MAEEEQNNEQQQEEQRMLTEAEIRPYLKCEEIYVKGQRVYWVELQGTGRYPGPWQYGTSETDAIAAWMKEYNTPDQQSYLRRIVKPETNE